MSYYNLLSIGYQDTNGGTSTPTMALQSQIPLVTSPYTGLLTAFQNASAMKLFGMGQQLGAPLSGSFGSSPHPLSTDQLRLQVSSGFSTGWIIIPGPVAALFKADGTTFDPTTSVSIAVVNAILAALGDPVGNPWTAVVGGTRRKVLVGPGGS